MEIKAEKVLLGQVKPGDTFIYNSCVCMRVDVPKYLQENGMVKSLDSLYTTRFTVPYINYKTNELGFMVEDVIVDFVDINELADKVEGELE